jgi:hypothetical protein
MAIDAADRQLAEACRKAAEASGQALAWTGDNAERLGSERAAIERQLRKSTVQAGKLALAAERPMCVGVFGPSQAGKSYLISALARPSGEDLIAEFDGIPGGLSFVRHINPQGGGEATGLVTRFTLKKQATPKGFPVAFRLLSELDVVKILTNTYLSDFKDEEERPARPEEVRQVLDRLKLKRRAQAADNLSIEAFYDLRDYVERYFRGHEFIKALGPAYWSEAERLGPYLTATDRAELLSFLWGRHEFFTRIYTRLQAALAELGHAEQAYAAIEALRDPGAEATQGPRRDSIIDVNTLWALNEPNAETIVVATDDGKRVRLPRPLATALIAELRIQMQKQPWRFFEHTDLLDFPGARVRENYRVEQVRENPDLVPRCFLRGKVAYLFERYCADLELSSMLLCIGPSNQEVRTLPKMIEEWVAATHGSTPEERARQETVLFFVLTKFDTEFDEKAGKLDPALAFDTRLRHSLTEFFGATGEWVHEWQPRTPFQNTYWLRSPNAYAEGLFAFSDDKRELAIHPHKQQRLAEIKPLYLATELVQRHFADPERAWEEGLRLNDGGVTYLAQQLEPVCNPSIKRRQVAARLVELAAQVREALAPFFVSGDLAEEKEKRLAQALATIAELEFAAEEGRFGRFIHAFQVEEDQLASLYLRVAAERAEESSTAETQPQRQRGSGRLLGRLGGVPAADAPAAKATGGDRRAERFAAAALEAWMDEMRQQAAGDMLPAELRVAGGILTGVVSELAQAARRLVLQDRIAQRLAARAGTPKQPKQAMASGALVASEAINRFVATLGYGEAPPAARPQTQDASGRERPIFTRPPIVGDMPNLPAERQPPGEQSAIDWMAAYLRMVEDNASTLDGRAIDLEQNRRLGQLLGNLRAVESGVAV